MKRKYAFKSEPVVDYLSDPGDPPTCGTCTNPCSECSDWWRDRRNEVVGEFHGMEDFASELEDRYIGAIHMLNRVDTILDECQMYLEDHKCDAFAGCSICALRNRIVDGRAEVEQEVNSRYE